VNNNVGLVLSRAASLEKVYEPVVAVEVGSTTHVTVKVRNSAGAGNLYNSSFAVVFEIDPSSTGAAVLLGGEGEEGDGRYDVSNALGESTIAMKITAPGPIFINAAIPACGINGVGRWCSEIILDPAFSTTAVGP